MGSLEEGARTAIEDCLKVDSDSRVVLIIDEDSPEVKQALVKSVQDVNPESVDIFSMEDFGKREEDPTDSRPPLGFPAQVEEALNNCTHSMYAAVSYPQELKTFRMPLLNIVFKRGIYHAHMPDISRDMMEGPMCADYGHVRKISKRLNELLEGVTYVKIRSESGTDLKVKLNDNHKWEADDGYIKPGILCNLPAGEMCIFPVTADGKLSLDGKISGGLAERKSEEEFAEYNAANGGPFNAAFIDGDMQLGRDVEGTFAGTISAYLFSHFYASRIAELGFGTNPGIRELTGVGLSDIKAYGAVHITIGMSTDSAIEEQNSFLIMLMHQLFHMEEIMKNRSLSLVIILQSLLIL